MEQVRRGIGFRNIRLPLLLTFILSDVAADNYIFRHLSDNAHEYHVWLLMGFLLLEIIAAPIQSGFSDFNCRKKSLIISLSFSLLSLIFIFFYNQNLLVTSLAIALIILTKAGFGNTTPMSWAGIADTQTRNFRFSLGLSTGAFAFGYFILIFINKLFGVRNANLVLIFLFLILLMLCAKYFFDFADEASKTNSIDKNNSKLERGTPYLHLMTREFKLIVTEFKQVRTRRALITFFLWEVSLYSIHMLDVDFHLPEFANLTTSMVFGYFLGIGLLKLFESVEDKKMIRVGYNICVLSVVPFFIIYPFVNNSRMLALICYFFYNLGTAFLAPSLFAILSKERKQHEQGKIYGLIDSTDTVAFLLAAIVVVLYKFMRLSPIYIVSFSFVVFVLSWLPYGKFEETQKGSTPAA